MEFSSQTLRPLMHDMHGKRVLIIGDVMLDAYLFGEATRISPEAPVPVVRINRETYLLGGAGNVARNIAALGGTPTLVGHVGDDAEAGRLTGLLKADNIACGLVKSPTRRTTLKTRILAGRQQIARMDIEDGTPFSESETASLLDAIRSHLPGHEVIVLSDYAKGFMSEAFMQGLAELLRRSEAPTKVLVDPKPSNISFYRDVTLLTPNTKEAGECAGMPIRTRDEILAAGEAIMRKTGAPHLLTTLGPDGMALFLHEDEVWHIPTFAQNVFDVTGAGDTVIATLALALAAGGELLPSCILANAAAGIVIASVGAATASQAQLAAAVEAVAIPPLTRWK